MGNALAGRVAVVTGASKGIGAGIARRFAAEGARVVCVSRGAPDETLSTIRIDGGEAAGIQADIANRTERACLAERVLSEYGHVDVLVNNAAGGGLEPGWLTLSDARIDHGYEINFMGPFDLMRRFAPAMVERRRGWMLNIGTRVATLPGRSDDRGALFGDVEKQGGTMVYGATKAALARLTISMAAQLEESGVVVNSLSPVAAVWTPGVQDYGLERFRNQPGWYEEPVETMAEAALALCTAALPATGLCVYSEEYLSEIGRAVWTLDGRRLLNPPDPA